MWKNLAFVLLLCTCAPPPSCAARWLAPSYLPLQHRDVTFVATIDREKMLVNGTVSYTLTLNNATGEQLQPPDFKGFKVVSGPARTIGSQSINGAFSSYESFRWVLQPLRTGKLTIGPASIRVNGRSYRTNSRIVTVLPVDAAAQAAAADHFLQVELSADSAYVGQQVILNLNLYSAGQVLSNDLLREPDFTDFFVQPRRQYDGRPRSVIENGKSYNRRTLGSLALFPTKSGRLVIAPYQMALMTVAFREVGGVSRRYRERVPLVTDTIFLEVTELPQPAPDGFSGAVGNYRYQVQADRNSMTTDDALTFRVTVTGEGDIQRLTGAPPVDPQAWDIYDPEILEEQFLDSPTGMLGRKIMSYKVVPKRAGNYTLRPALVYFNTDSARYVTLAPTAFEVVVTGGEGTPTYAEDNTAVADSLPLVLLPATYLPAGRVYGKEPASHWPYRLCFFLPLLLGGAILGGQRYRKHLDSRDPEQLARAYAAKVARQRLRLAKQALDQAAPKAFYDAIEEALLGYLKDKFQLSGATLRRKNIREQLTSAGADETLLTRYDTLLERCEVALYSGQATSDDLQRTYADAQALIEDTDRTVQA